MKLAPTIVSAMIVLSLSAPSANGFTASPPPPQYRLVELPPLDSHENSNGWDVNNSGLVVGASFWPDATSTTWTNGAPSALPFGPSEATAVNDLGHIVGTLSLGGGSAHGYFYDGSSLRDVHAAALNVVGSFSLAIAVNNADQVVGWASTSGAGPRSAYLWHDGVATLLGTLGGPESAAFAINNLGQVAGSAETSNHSDRAFIWTDQNGNGASDAGEMVQLPDMGLSSAVNSLNDSGVAAGFVLNASFQRQPVIWTDSSAFTLLPMLPGSIDGEAYAINNHGSVVGVMAQQGGMLWQDGQVYNLNDLISPPSAFRINRPTAINDLGWIVGYGVSSGRETGFLLIPIPEPNSLVLALGIAATVVCVRRTPLRRHPRAADVPEPQTQSAKDDRREDAWPERHRMAGDEDFGPHDHAEQLGEAHHAKENAFLQRRNDLLWSHIISLVRHGDSERFDFF